MQANNNSSSSASSFVFSEKKMNLIKKSQNVGWNDNLPDEAKSVPQSVVILSIDLKSKGWPFVRECVLRHDDYRWVGVCVCVRVP